MEWSAQQVLLRPPSPATLLQGGGLGLVACSTTHPPPSLPPSTTNKVNPRYYGPYQAIEVINEVVVRLRLMPGARIHDVFHIGLLKIFRGQPPNAAPPLPPMHHGAAVPVPAAAVKARLARGVRQILIQWQGQPPLAATWEDIDDFVQRYPKFQLEDDLLIEGERCHVGQTVFM